MLTDILVQVMSGLSRGMVLFIVASGLTLIFGVLRVINFAHGSLYMLAAYLTHSIAMLVGSNDLSFYLALLIAPVAVALLGVVIEVTMMRRISHRPHQYQLILTFALTLLIADGVKMVWGGDYYTVARPSFLEGSFTVFGQPFPSYYGMLIIVGFVIAGGLLWMLTRTRLGKVLDAAVSDGEMVSALGINVPALYTAVFAFGVWLAGLGGVLAAPVGSVSLGMDNSIIIESFAVVIIGGVGNVIGALLGAIIIGVMQSVGIMVAPKMAIAFIFVVLCAVLILRPRGLMGVKA